MLQITPNSPAHKAWATRRAMAAAAKMGAAPIVPVAPVKISPMADTRMIEMWLDRAEVGCGVRRYIVLEIGERIVKLFSATKLLTLQVDRAEFDRYARPVRAKSAAVVSIIKRNVAMVDRVNDAAKSTVLLDGGANTTRAMQVMA